MPMDYVSFCNQFYRYDYRFAKECADSMQQLFDSPIPWMGLYAAAASLLCSFAMAADLLRGFYHKRLWFPSKFFSFNATTLTLLTIAMKLPVDLSTALWGTTDLLAKLSSNILMSVAMGNFLTSFASMQDTQIFMNIVALGILIITIIVDISIQFNTGVVSYEIWGEEIFAMTTMFVLFVTLGFLSLAIPSIKLHLELRSAEIQKMDASDEQDQRKFFRVEKLKQLVQKYWVMAVTGSPQFVVARSVICDISGAICVLNVFTLVEAQIRMYSIYNGFPKSKSNYKWSTSFILFTQSVGVVVGTIGPAFRWFTASSINCKNSMQRINTGTRNALKVEHYWIQRLLEWKERPLTLRIQCRKCRKLIQDAKSLTLKFSIKLQKVIVVTGTVVRLISVVFIYQFLSCYQSYKRNQLATESSTGAVANGNEASHSDSEPVPNRANLDLNRYVLLLEGEDQLPAGVLNNICDTFQRLIQNGKKKQPKNLHQIILKASVDFKGVAQFDSNQVPHLNIAESPNCWTLPVVTLTSIAFALPNVNGLLINGLLRSVREGLLYAKLVDQNVDTGGDLLNIRNTADVVWVGVELYRKWLEKDLHKMANNSDLKPEITLKNLADTAEQIVMDFKKSINGSHINEPLRWPVRVIAANSMYRISQSMLLVCRSIDDIDNEKLLEQLTVMIADILGACFTNLPSVITTKCLSGTIDDREASVKHAASTLGEIEEILKSLERHPWLSRSNSDSGQLKFIDEWRALMKDQDTADFNCASGHDATSSSNELHEVIE